jgi:hypothetical protein
MGYKAALAAVRVLLGIHCYRRRRPGVNVRLGKKPARGAAYPLPKSTGAIHRGKEHGTSRR